MATCKYCGLSASIFSHAHKECEEKHQQGLDQLEKILRQYFAGGQTVASMRQAIVQLRKPTFLKKSDVEQCALRVIDDHAAKLQPPYNRQALTQIDDFINGLTLERQAMNAHGSLDLLAERTSQLTIINNLQRGILPQTTATLPVMLSRGEAVLWVYNNVALYQEKIERQYNHITGGFSFRIMKGVYYRTGTGRSKPVERSVMNLEAQGQLIVTNKNLIFYSQTKGVKVPFNKIISVAPYTDGLEIHKDGSSKRMVFQGFDCWFVMNILSFVN